MLRKIIVSFLASSTLIILFAYTFAVTVNAGGPWYVSPTGSDSNDCLSLTTTCQTIAAAIDKATSGDTIIIPAGTYVENLSINKDIVFQGSDKYSTIIDGNNLDEVFYITSGITVTINNW